MEIKITIRFFDIKGVHKKSMMWLQGVLNRRFLKTNLSFVLSDILVFIKTTCKALRVV